MKKIAKPYIPLLIVICLSLAACASTPTATEPVPTLPDTSPSGPTDAPEAQPVSTAEPTDDKIPGGDKDLSYLIAENDLTDQNGTYGNGHFFLTHENQPLFWFGKAGLFDLSAGKAVAIIELPKEHFLEKIELTNEGIAFFWKDSPENCQQQEDWTCENAPVMLNVYDSRLNLVNTLNTTEAFGLTARLHDPSSCALSEDGHKVVCINDGLRQFVFFNLQTRALEPTFDFSKIHPADTFGISVVKFAGNDRYLAFVGNDYDDIGFGIIDLSNNTLVDYTLWAPVSDDILVTNEAIYFHEQLKSLFIPRTGKVFRYAFDAMQKQEIQLTDSEESMYIAVSANGKYLATARNSGGDSVTIKVYDCQNMAVLREITLNTFVNTLAIDEADRLLFIRLPGSDFPHLAQYSF
jgi:WD40 repeat protein